MGCPGGDEERERERGIQIKQKGLRRVTVECKLQALVYDILPLEEGARKRCSECGCSGGCVGGGEEGGKEE